MWNELIKIRDRHEYRSEVYNKARMLLQQLNTAGGPELMRNEIEIFIEEENCK